MHGWRGPPPPAASAATLRIDWLIACLTDPPAPPTFHPTHARMHAGFVFSGLGPDYRVLVRRARKRAASYHLQYRVGLFSFFSFFLYEKKMLLSPACSSGRSKRIEVVMPATYSTTAITTTIRPTTDRHSPTPIISPQPIDATTPPTPTGAPARVAAGAGHGRGDAGVHAVGRRPPLRPLLARGGLRRQRAAGML